jgi:hypothetical protein
MYQAVGDSYETARTVQRNAIRVTDIAPSPVTTNGKPAAVLRDAKLDALPAELEAMKEQA